MSLLESLHHVTATVDQAQPDLGFCAGVLGLRLVKRTVNFDNHHVYHFYYGDERGTPGTIWTTFPYHGRGVRVGVKGAGQVTVTSFAVPAGSLAFWKARFAEHGVAVAAEGERFGDRTLTVADPSDLAVQLIATNTDLRPAWTAGLSTEVAVRGLHSVTLTLRESGPTLEAMTGLLGFTIVERSADWIRLAVNGGGPGRFVDLFIDADAPAAVNGLGTVHHVAFAIADAGAQVSLRDELMSLGYKVTPVMDRQYFRSIYFREPGGVLFEVATLQPGFTIDEPLAALGERLKLPPWEEAHRGEIEAGLASIRVPAIAANARHA